jgi:hypothetical protein
MAHTKFDYFRRLMHFAVFFLMVSIAECYQVAKFVNRFDVTTCFSFDHDSIIYC